MYNSDYYPKVSFGDTLEVYFVWFGRHEYSVVTTPARPLPSSGQMASLGVALVRLSCCPAWTTSAVHRLVLVIFWSILWDLIDPNCFWKGALLYRAGRAVDCG